MDKVDVVEVMMGGYLGTFCMLGFLGLWEYLFGLRMNEVGWLLGMVMGVISAGLGILVGMSLSYMLRRWV